MLGKLLICTEDQIDYLHESMGIYHYTSGLNLRFYNLNNRVKTMQKDPTGDELLQKINDDIEIKGWVHDIRLLGGISFLILRSSGGLIQITALKNKTDKEMLRLLEGLHQEDVVAIKGTIIKSDKTELGIEILLKEIRIINRANVSLPLDPRNVTKANADTQLDWRFMYFRTKEGRSIFRISSEITKSFREFLINRGYLEIQPPVIIASASEGGAELFAIPYFEKQAFLAQSPQLYKQMCAISLERVFSIMPIFRAEKFNTPVHLNEIRQMDLEQAFSDDEEVMKILEEVFVYILNQVKTNCAKELKILDRELFIPKLPLRRVTYTEAIELLKKKGEKINWGEDFTKAHEKLLRDIVKDEAFFIKDWPVAARAFYAMPYEDNPKICKAFDLIYGGLEISSGAQRIHIPELLERQLKLKGLNPSNFESYINSFRFGAPPHSGWSIGLERLTLIVTNRSNIREVTMFPRDRNRITP